MHIPDSRVGYISAIATRINSAIYHCCVHLKFGTSYFYLLILAWCVSMEFGEHIQALQSA